MFNFSFGGGGGPGMRPRKDVDTNKFYELLGVAKDADQATIKKAYRKMAMIHHPDKGGEEEKFKEITKAYEVLSDPEKKEIYDTHGEDGLEGGGGGGGGMDIFDLFTGGGPGRQTRRQRKGEDVMFPLKVTLEELYTGTTKKLRLTKNIICDVCKGKGGKGVTTCKDCKGQGVRIIIRQLGPGMIQQMQAQCSPCNGTGQIIPEKEKCKNCKGNKTVKEKKQLEVFVNKGMAHGERMIFTGEADQMPDTESGDVVVVLSQQEHDVFKREGPHLFMKKTITLLEALCGFQFTVEHLDGRVLLVKSEEGAVYKPGDVKCIKEEGMPNPKNPYQKGHLIIEFNVEFPKSNTIKANEKKLLAKILPGGEEKSEMDLSNVEEVALTDVDVQEERRRAAAERRREQYEEDEERGGRQQAQCSNQ